MNFIFQKGIFLQNLYFSTDFLFTRRGSFVLARELSYQEGNFLTRKGVFLPGGNFLTRKGIFLPGSNFLTKRGIFLPGGELQSLAWLKLVREKPGSLSPKPDGKS